MGSTSVVRSVVVAALATLSTRAAADAPRRGEAMVAATAVGMRAAPPRPVPQVTEAAPHPRPFRDEVDARLLRFESQIATLDLDAIELRFDAHTRRAHLLLRGETAFLSFRLASDIFVRGGAAAFDARLEVAAAGHRLEITLPDVELAPRSYLGERYLEVRVPFVRRTF